MGKRLKEAIHVDFYWKTFKPKIGRGDRCGRKENSISDLLLNSVGGVVVGEKTETIVLSENDIARIINGEEILLKIDGKKVIIRQSYMKDIAVDMLVRKNRVMNTVANSFEY